MTRAIGGAGEERQHRIGGSRWAVIPKETGDNGQCMEQLGRRGTGGQSQKGTGITEGRQHRQRKGASSGGRAQRWRHP